MYPNENMFHLNVSRQDNPIIGTYEQIPGGHMLSGYLHSWEMGH